MALIRDMELPLQVSRLEMSLEFTLLLSSPCLHSALHPSHALVTWQSETVKSDTARLQQLGRGPPLCLTFHPRGKRQKAKA